MSENEKQADPELEKEQSEIRQRLIRRVVIAIGLVGAAAISLPLLDKFKSSPEVKIAPPPATDAQTTRIIPAPNKPENPTEAEKPADSAAAKTPAPAEAVPPTAKTVEPVKTPEPSVADTKKKQPPQTPATEKQTPPPPIVSTQARPVPITTQPAKPSEPAIKQPALAEPDQPASPSKPVIAHPATTPEPAQPSAPGGSNIPVVPRGKTLQSQGYTVQLGVFANYANAQALQQRLAANGIQAHLETRVQLGPFKDKQEAEEAYRKIKQLGLPAVLVGQ